MRTLVIQRGHVPRTTGATGTAGEQEVVTLIAAAMREIIPTGWRLVVINADEPSYRYRGDAFMALHCDGSNNKLATGASVGYTNAEGKALAERWKAAYAAQGWPYGFKEDNYTAGLRGYYGYKYALAEGTKACVVVEHGFLTNAKDAAWIRANIDKCAKAAWMAAAGAVKEDDPVEITYKAMACSTRMAGATERDQEFERKLKALCKEYNKALFEARESRPLPSRLLDWWRLQ